RIAAHAKDLLSAVTSAIFLPSDGPGLYRAIVAMGLDAEAIKGGTVRAGTGIIGTLVQAGRAELVNDTSQDPRAVPIPGSEERPHQRLMVAPLLAGDTVRGVMAVWRNQ